MGLFFLLFALSVAQWQDDIAFLARELPARHINPFPRTSRAQFDRDAAELRERIPSMNEPEIRAGILRLVASVGDAHSVVIGWDRQDAWSMLPITIADFEDGVYVVGATEPYAKLLGTRVERIGDKTVEEAIRAMMPYVSTDNEIWARKQMFQLHLRTAEMLHVAGLTNSPERVRIETSAGTAEIAPGQGTQVPATKADPPIYRERANLPYWAAVLGGKTLYFQYNRCAEDPRRPMNEFQAELMRLAETPGLERIVLDMRLNGGGNSSLLMPWMEAVRKSRFNQKGKLFVLIGRNTFSSALLNSYWMHANTNATLVGEPTGGKPNRFGELGVFELPNSRIKVSYSKKRFVMTKDSDPPSLMPDRTVLLKFADFAAGLDPVLEAVTQ